MTNPTVDLEGLKALVQTDEPAPSQFPDLTVDIQLGLLKLASHFPAAYCVIEPRCCVNPDGTVLISWSIAVSKDRKILATVTFAESLDKALELAIAKSTAPMPFPGIEPVVVEMVGVPK